MQPELAFCFAVKVEVGQPVVVANSRESGKRQLIPIVRGVVSGELNGEVLPGGVDSQIIEPDGLCRLSARYALATELGTVYVENNGIRRVPPAFRPQLFGDNMQFFDAIPPQALYFRTVPQFEVYDPRLAWLKESIFISTGERTPHGVTIDFYRVT
ncbi:DUF3237 family protein [Kalamiella sp. sgz302252]|uniref:DUF3237 family protein n=1 Tax=Pantoea sp. sgz302252 TaxID=3341827 RepID=UPI0036D39A80